MSAFLDITQRLSDLGPRYAIFAAGVVVPAMVCCVRRPDVWRWLVAVLVCFAAALNFRACDARLAAAGWPHGSHYLWHIFGGLATFLMFSFLYALRAGDQEQVLR